MSATAAADPNINTSPQAQQLFFTWWNYENIATADSHISRQSAYTYGQRACVKKVQGIDTAEIIRVIRVDGGYTMVGAEGVYKSALEALCPAFRGYQTQFDNKVNGFINTSAVPPTTPPLSVMDYGWFLRRMCDAPGTTMDSMVGYIRTRQELAIVQAFGSSAQMTSIVLAASPCSPLL